MLQRLDGHLASSQGQPTTQSYCRNTKLRTLGSMAINEKLRRALFIFKASIWAYMHHIHRKVFTNIIRIV